MKVIAIAFAILICVGSWLGLALTLVIISTQVSELAKEVISTIGTCLLVILFWALLWNIESLYEWFLEKSGYYASGG